MKRKFLSVLLALCMMLTLLPATAFAEETGEPGDTTTSDVQTGETGDGSTSKPTAEDKLVADLEKGGTVTLTDDVVITKSIFVRNEVTLDLNGHKITVAEGSSIWTKTTSAMISVIGADAKLTVVNEKETGGIIAKAGDSYTIDVWNGATLEINCTNETEFLGNIHTIYVGTSGKAIINGGRYDILQHASGKPHAFVLNCLDASSTSGASTITVNKGVIVGVDPRDTKSDPADPTNYVASTSKVTELGEKSQCKIDSGSCGELTVYEVAPIDGLAGEKQTDETTGTTTVTIIGSAESGKVDESSSSELGGTTKDTIKVDASAAGNEATANAKVTIPAETAATMKQVQTVEVKANDVTVTLPKEAVGKIAATTVEVTIVVKTDETPEGAAAQYEVKVTAGSDEILSGSSNGDIKITVPAPEKAQANSIFAYWVSEEGTVLEQVDAVLNSDNTVTITTTHLSKYQVRTTKAEVKEATYTNNDGKLASGTLEEAVTGAKAGTEIKLNADVEISGCIDIEKNLTINGNGHKIKVAVEEGKTFTASTKTTSGGQGKMSVFRVSAANKEAARVKLTLDNVTVDANQKALVIYCGDNADLEINGADTLITGGKLTTPANSYPGGVYMNRNSKLVMNGGTITGNSCGGSYANDGYLEYSSDLWVGTDAEATINGGTIGKAFVNATKIRGDDNGGALTVAGGTIENAFVEAEADKDGKILTGSVMSVSSGKISTLLIALDTEPWSNNTPEYKRAVAKATNVTNASDVKGLAIPDGTTAEIITNTNGTEITNDITIGEGATLEIPEGVTVKVTKKGDALPTITNKGTLSVGGELIAGTTTSDTDYLQITGSGIIQATGNGKIDLDTSTKAIKITLNLNGGTGVEETVITQHVAKDGGKTNYTLPNPTKSGCTLKNWTGSDGETYQRGAKVEVSADITLIAQWTKNNTGGNRPGNSGGSSDGGDSSSGSSVSVSSASNGRVTASPSSAGKGDTVTLTVKPNTGYELDTLTVKDSKGNTVAVTKVSDTRYTFTMPDGKVTVTPVFVKAQGQQPVTPSLSFTDVPAGAYYSDAVAWAVEQGITTGTSASTFSPEDPCTRGQIVTFLWRAAGSPDVSGSTPFADVAAEAYYAKAVAWAVEQNITTGTSATTFSPDAVCTRGQTVTFLHRFAGTPAAGGTNSFADLTPGAYYADAVQWAVENGITEGTGANTFSPDARCTRGQIVTFLYRDMA